MSAQTIFVLVTLLTFGLFAGTLAMRSDAAACIIVDCR